MEGDHRMYQEHQLVSIAQRENNQKRGYLVVNPLQGKHCPVSPSLTLQLCKDLAQKIAKAYPGETILFVGFAETATAIGAAVALEHGGYYLQTTREEVEQVQFYDFSESHSHATQQKLSQTDVSALVPTIQRILFVEDEVTTGNTILNLVTLLREKEGQSLHFAVLSFLNGMDRAAEERYKDQGIDLHYLVKTDHSSYTKRAATTKGDGDYHRPRERAPLEALRIPEGYWNTRRAVETSRYAQGCQALWEALSQKLPPLSGRVLVLGTEEFMYPALFVGSKFQEGGCEVRCHATTRSPIVVSREEGYPLQARWSLPSFYDPERQTYLYQLEAYDHVLILTDSTQEDLLGAEVLCHALQSVGNTRISLIRWG